MEGDSYHSYFPAQYPQPTIAPPKAAPQCHQQYPIQGGACYPNEAPQYHQPNVSHPGNFTVQYRQQTNAQVQQYQDPTPQDYLSYRMQCLPNLTRQNIQQYNLQRHEYIPNFPPHSYQRGLYSQADTLNSKRADLEHQPQFAKQHMHSTHPSRPDEGTNHNPLIGAFTNYPDPPQLENILGTQYAHMSMQIGLPPHLQKVPQHTAGSHCLPPANYSNPGCPPQHTSPLALPVVPTSQDQAQIPPLNAVDMSSVPLLCDTQLQEEEVLASRRHFDAFVSVFGYTPNSTPRPPYWTHASINLSNPVARAAISSERPLETSHAQPQETVASIAKSKKRLPETSDTQPQETVANSKKRPLETSDTQPQGPVESHPYPEKRQKSRPRKSTQDEPMRDEPIQGPVPLTEEQLEKRKAAQARLWRWGMGKNKPAWMINPQYRTVNGNAIHIEKLDREKYAQINSQELIDQKDMAWQKDYEERQEKINNLRHEMQMKTRDEEITDEMVWDQYYRPPRPTILDSTLEARDTVTSKVRASTSRATPNPNTKAGRKAAAKETKDAARAAAKEEKAARKQAEKEEKVAKREAEKVAKREAEKVAKREAEEEAKKAMKAMKKTITKTTTNSAMKATKKSKAARKPSSSSNDSGTFTGSPMSVSTTPTSPEEVNAQDTDENMDALGEIEMLGEVDVEYENEEPVRISQFEEEYPTMVEEEAPAEGDLSGKVDAPGWEDDEFERSILEMDAVLEADALEFDEDGYNEDGFDRAGFTAEGYDKNGFDEDGFNAEGFDKDGFNEDGFNEEVFGRNGLNEKGVDKDGFNQQGFNKDGFDRDGFDKDGYDKQGWHRDDSEEE